MFRLSFICLTLITAFGCSDDDAKNSADAAIDSRADSAQPDAATDSEVGGDASGDADTTEDASAGEASAGDGVADAGGNCSGTIGATASAETLGATVYNSGETVVVSDVIFDAATGENLVTVTGAATNVVFERVTFRGSAVGDSGRTLSVGGQASVEIRNAIFEGTPAEDHILFSGHEPSNIDCTRFTSSPGGAHINIAQGGEVLVSNSDFSGGGAIENRNAFSFLELSNSIAAGEVLLDEGTTGVIFQSDVAMLKLYLAVNTLVEGNRINLVEHGDAASDNDAIDTYFLNNEIESAEDNDGSCYAVGNTGADPVPFCMQEAAPWH